MLDPALFFFAFAAIALWVMTIAIIVAIAAGTRTPVSVSVYPLIVLYAVVLHYVWAAALLVDPRAGDATSLAGLYRLVGPELLPYLLFVVATLALAYAFLFSKRRLWVVVLALPQQGVMVVSAATAIEAMLAGSFADGIRRPPAFIVADQAPAVIAALLHTVALIAGFWGRKGRALLSGSGV